MKLNRLLFLLVLLPVLLQSCQSTNFSDLIDYGRIRSAKVDSLQRKVILKFERKAALLDSLDNIIDNKTIRKGSEVTVQGFVHRYIGSKKIAPHFFRENYTPVVDAWLVLLPDGSRAFMEVPEMAIGVVGKNGESVTDVKSQSGSDLFLYKTTSSDQWINNPGIEYDSRQDVAIYLPIRHFRSIAEGITYEECDRWWLKVLYKIHGPIDFFNRHKARHLLFKDGAFYKYHPLITMTDKWSRIVQLILSTIFLFLVLAFAVPWLAVRTVWRIPLLPNELIKLLAFIVDALYFAILGNFFGIESWGWVFWILFAGLNCGIAIKTDIDYGRCPYCHKIGLSYDKTVKGNWYSSDHKRKEKEEVGREERIYERSTGVGMERVHETIIHTRIKNMVDTVRSRSVTTKLYCNHCHREIDLYDTESQTVDTREV